MFALASLPAVAQNGFEENLGQYPQEVRYVYRPAAYLTQNSLELPSIGYSIVFTGGNSAPTVSPSDTLPYTVSSYSGTRGVTNIHRYTKVRYKEIYPGIDLEFSMENSFTWRFYVAPGADPSMIRMSYPNGRPMVSPFADGQLLLWLSYGRWGQNSDAAQGTTAVSLQYSNPAFLAFGFQLGSYDHTQPLVIRTTLPITPVGEFIGAPVARENGLLMVAGTAGIRYTCGTNSIGGLIPCAEVAVRSFDSAGAILWETVFRDSSSAVISGVAADGLGSLYLSGDTTATDFPATLNLLPVVPPARSAYVAKLDRFGHLVFSTLFAGATNSGSTQVLIDAAGNAYVGGQCTSTYPAVECKAPSARVGYVAKFDAIGRQAWVAGTPNFTTAFAVAPEGAVLAAGSIKSTAQAFLAELNTAGTVWTTLSNIHPLSTTVDQMLLDATGHLWITGATSANSTYLSRHTRRSAIVLFEPSLPAIQQFTSDASGNLNLITVGSGVYQLAKGPLASGCGPLLSKLSPDGTLLASRVVNTGTLADNLYVTTDALGAPSVAPVLAATTPELTCALNAASLASPDNVAPGEIVSVFGIGITPTGSPASVRLLIDGQPCPLLYAGNNQINAILPYGISTTTGHRLTAEVNGVSTAPRNVDSRAQVPALFTLDGSYVLVLNQDGTLNSPGNPASLGSTVTLFGTGFGETSPASTSGGVAPSSGFPPMAIPNVALVGTTGLAYADILYAGASPGMSTSVTQLNVRLPATVSGFDQLYPALESRIMIVQANPVVLLKIALKP